MRNCDLRRMTVGLQENKQLLHSLRVAVSVVWRIRASRSNMWGSVGPQC